MTDPRGKDAPAASGAREPSERTGVYADEELARALRRGDGAAFEQVAREQAPRLHRFALHLTGRPEEAEDLVQETLVRALKTLPGFEGRAALSTYLLRALSNVWKNRLRAKSRSKVVEWFRAAGSGASAGEAREFDPPDAAPSPLAAMEAEDRAEAVRAALAKLDPDRRMAILLREMEDLSYEEIAGMTGVPVGTVRSRIARGREDLRRLLRGRV